MRTVIAIAALAATACTASATVKRQSAIANLQTYRTVKVRVDASDEGRRWTRDLEAQVVHKLATTCRFDRVVPNAQHSRAPADLVVDLNIQRAYRGSDGLIQNPNQAVMDVLLVLSDGSSEDLLGSAWIRGKSPAMLVNGASPESQALSAVADSVAKVLNMSGCALARLDPEPVEQPIADGSNTATGAGDGGGAGAGEGEGAGEGAGDGAGEGEGEGEGAGAGDSPADDTVARAEALNDEGKALFRAADIEGAAGKFREAIELTPDSRYAFNLCVAYDALKRFDDAVAACQSALDGNPDARLRAKIDDRIQRIRNKQ